MNLIEKNELKINSILFEFINKEVIPGTGINENSFWKNFSSIVHELAPINKELIKKREKIQEKIDKWHKDYSSEDFNKEKYIKFLKSISYIVENGEDFKIDTSNVDEEISSIAGPQLVVPVDNARYAINAANARWGSLYDALYGTDVIPGTKNKGYDAERGNKVIEYVRKHLDSVVPLNSESWINVSNLKVENNELVVVVNDKIDNLKDKFKFIGFNGEKDKPTSILLKTNGLHLD